jgi:hypothetical protein
MADSAVHHEFHCHVPMPSQQVRGILFYFLQRHPAKADAGISGHFLLHNVLKKIRMFLAYDCTDSLNKLTVRLEEEQFPPCSEAGTDEKPFWLAADLHIFGLDQEKFKENFFICLDFYCKKSHFKYRAVALCNDPFYKGKAGFCGYFFFALVA